MRTIHTYHIVERGSSVVERRTRNRESPDSNPPLLPFRNWAFSFSPLTPQVTQLYKWIPGYRRWWNVSDLVLARNCCLARMLPGEAELVWEWTGLSGRAKSVKRFERSNGLDTALYKNYLYHCVFIAVDEGVANVGTNLFLLVFV